MVVTVLLAVIIIGLVSMFAQTQKAFRTSMTQVDVLESGRAVTELLTRDLEQITPSYGPDNTINFFAKVLNNPLLIQPITGNPTGPGRINIMEDMFFLARENQTWTGYGYMITNHGDGIGSLYRFSKSLGFGGNPGSLVTSYFNTPIANMSHIVDGVVHFKVRCFNPNNVWTTTEVSTNSSPANSAILQGSATVQYEVEHYEYYSNAVPAFVELELGVLEERSRDRALAIPAGLARSNYLAQQASKVHLFRIRVPVRNVDPAAYQ